MIFAAGVPAFLVVVSSGLAAVVAASVVVAYAILAYAGRVPGGAAGVAPAR